MKNDKNKLKKDELYAFIGMDNLFILIKSNCLDPFFRYLFIINNSSLLR